MRQFRSVNAARTDYLLKNVPSLWLCPTLSKFPAELAIDTLEFLLNPVAEVKLFCVFLVSLMDTFLEGENPTDIVAISSVNLRRNVRTPSRAE